MMKFLLIITHNSLNISPLLMVKNTDISLNQGLTWLLHVVPLPQYSRSISSGRIHCKYSHSWPSTLDWDTPSAKLIYSAKVCKSMQKWHFPTVNQMFNGYWYWLKPEYSGEPENSWKLWIVCPTPKLETIWFLDLFRLYLLNHQLHTEAKPGDHRTKTIWISSTKRPGTDAFFIVFGCGLPQYVDKVTSQRKAFCGRKLDHGPPLGFIVYLSLSCRSGAMLHWRLLLRKHSNHPQKWYRHYCRDL
jgi:hypothetical protein